MGVFIGIDPGKKGGWSAIKHDGLLLGCYSASDVFVFSRFIEEYAAAVTRAYIEKAQAMPGQGVTSMFSYGQGFGEQLGVMAALRVPVQMVTPRKWQRVMIPGSKPGSSKKDALTKARQLFPQETFIPERCRKPHDGIVDAVLIAEYGRRRHAG